MDLILHAVQLNTFELQVLKRSIFFAIVTTSAEYFGSHKINPKDDWPELMYLFSSHFGGLHVQIEYILVIKVKLTATMASAKQFTIKENG